MLAEVILQFVKVLLGVRSPNHSGIASGLHVAEQPWGAAMDTAHDTNGAVDQAALTANFLEHALDTSLVVLGHVRGHEHVTLEWAAEEAAEKPAAVQVDCPGARVKN